MRLYARMKKLITISELVATLHMDGESVAVHATADAHFDEANSRLRVDLDSCLRPTDGGVLAGTTALPELPAKATVTESVDLADAFSLTKEIFSSWVRRVRESIGKAHPNPPAL